MRYFLIFWLIHTLTIPIFIILLSMKQLALSLIILLFLYMARTPMIRIIIRSGNCGKSPRACDSMELLSMFKEPPTVVGRGWGYFLMRKSANSPVLHMFNFTGRRTDGSWAAGTTIETVANYYKSQSLTFPSHPGSDNITIGSWFASGCHGSCGDAGAPSSSVFKCAEVVCFDPPSIRNIESYEMLRDIFDAYGHNCIITWIQFHKLWVNRTIQKSAESINSIESCKRWLSNDSILRVIFVGSARDAFGIRWLDIYDKNVQHIDPHICSRCCTFLQADICSTCCGCREKNSKWNGITTLREANKWTPTLWPFETLLTVIGGYKNFEIIFRVSKMTPDILLEMLRKLRKMHKKMGGRTEIRFMSQVFFWDVSMQHSFEMPFIELMAFGVTRVALHMSKYNPRVNILPVVPVGHIYFNKETNVRF